MSNRYLPLFVSQVRLELSHVTKIDIAAVERDIAARRHEANVGKLFGVPARTYPARDRQARHHRKPVAQT